MVDSQKSAVYGAEDRLERLLDRALKDGQVRAFGSVWQPEHEIKFSNVEDIQHYVDRVLTHIGCQQPITVRRRKGATRAHYRAGTIAIPPREIGGGFALREVYVLHEVAHHLCRFGESHGAEFTRTYVDLLERLGRPITARLLQICYVDGHVKVAAN